MYSIVHASACVLYSAYPCMRSSFTPVASLTYPYNFTSSVRQYYKNLFRDAILPRIRTFKIYSDGCFRNCTTIVIKQLGCLFAF